MVVNERGPYAATVHTNPLFARLEILKLHDIIFLYTACFMYQLSKSSLPMAFDNLFTRTNTRHRYYIRFSSKSSFSPPNIRTNYGKFSIYVTFFWSKSLE